MKKPAKRTRSATSPTPAALFKHAADLLMGAAEGIAKSNQTIQTIYGVVSDFRLRFECVQQDFQRMTATLNTFDQRFREMDARLSQISHFVQAARSPPAFPSLGGAGLIKPNGASW